MCGICGFAFVSAQDRAGRQELQRMTGLLRHRGPDAEGFFDAPGIALGFRRLSIIDLESGDQPISNEDGTITVVCNGEIYNFVELRADLESRGHHFRTRSDVEVIVHLYEEHGPDCLRFLRGMFAFALWNSRDRSLILARDRFGIKPLHYAITPRRILFGSEGKAILTASDSVDRSLDPVALRDLMQIDFVPGTRTLWRGVSRVPAGFYLLYRDGVATSHQYWDVSFPEPSAADRRMSAEDWSAALRDKLEETVRIHLRSDVKVGTWLSPGIDSSTVTALASRLTSEPVEAFTLTFEDRGFNEAGRFPTLDSYAGYRVRRHTAYCADADFSLFPEAMWYHEVPTGVMIAGHILGRASCGRVKVVLTGEGSDEMLCGYNWYRRDKLLHPLCRLPQWMRRLMLPGRRFISGWNRGMTDLLLAPPEMNVLRFRTALGADRSGFASNLLSPALREMLPAAEEEQPLIRFPEEAARWHRSQKLQYMDIKIRMPEFVIHSLDRSSMSAGVEARVPFLDHELAALCSRIPVGLKLHRFREKHILREAVRGLVPDPIIARQKQGLGTPQHRWWQSELPDFAEEALAEDSLRAAGYFDPAEVRGLLERHRSGLGHNASALTGVLGVQLRDSVFSPARLG